MAKPLRSRGRAISGPKPSRLNAVGKHHHNSNGSDQSWSETNGCANERIEEPRETFERTMTMAISAHFHPAADQLEVFGERLGDAIKACRAGRAKTVAARPVAAAAKTVPSDEVLIDQIARGNQ